MWTRDLFIKSCKLHVVIVDMLKNLSLREGGERKYIKSERVFQFTVMTSYECSSHFKSTNCFFEVRTS